MIVGIKWGQWAAIALGGLYIAALVLAGPIATWVPRFSAPALFLGDSAEVLSFAYRDAGPETGFTFVAEISQTAFDDLTWRLNAPKSGADALCAPLDRTSRPKFSMPYQCARWDGATLVLEQKLSEDDTGWKLRQELTYEAGRLSWTLLEL